MTLNLTLASRWMIVQTSDFRLTTGLGRPPEETAQKQVVLKYNGWSGLLCYTGIARWYGHDTAKWLAPCLEGAGEQPTPRQVADHIALEGDAWLSRVAEEKRLHTFTLAAYEGHRRPVVYMISNYQRAGQDDLPRPLNHFQVSWHRPTVPRVYVTGWLPAVEDDDRAELIDRLRSERDPNFLRRAAAEVSRRCAPRSQEWIGENCVASHLLPDSSGEMQVFGDGAKEFVPTMILNGFDYRDDLGNFFPSKGLATPQLVAASWSASHDSASAMLLVFRDVATQAPPGW